MKKLICAAALAACALLPAGGIAGGGFTPQFGGKVEGDPNHYFGFDIIKQNGRRKVANMFVINAPVACFDPSNDGRDSGWLEGRIFVNAKGRFAATRTLPLVMRQRGNTTLKYRITGRLLKNNRARGTYKLRLAGGEPCYTGTLHWRAHRPAPPVPEP